MVQKASVSRTQEAVPPVSTAQDSGEPHSVPEGTLIALTQDEATIRTATRPSVAAGDGVRLHIHLPGLVDFDVGAQVTWIRRWPTHEGPAGFGVRFSSVSLPVRLALRRWLEENPPDGDTKLGVDVSHRYAVRLERGQLKIRVGGILEVGESQVLCDAVLSALDRADSPALAAYIDARELRACPEESLPRFGRWFQRLGRHRAFMGVLFANCAVARLQMRRLARESGIGDTLVCFENEPEARRFWEDLRDSGALAGRVA